MTFATRYIAHAPRNRPTPAPAICYQAAANSWFSQVFQTDYASIAVASRMSELMRFWLLGTYMASKLGVTFYLVSLTPTEQVEGVLARFGPHIADSKGWHFVATAWEEIYHYVCDHGAPTPDNQRLMAYLKNKTAGYDAKGSVIRAFPRELLCF